MVQYGSARFDCWLTTLERRTDINVFADDSLIEQIEEPFVDVADRYWHRLAEWIVADVLREYVGLPLDPLRFGELFRADVALWLGVFLFLLLKTVTDAARYSLDTVGLRFQ